MMVGGEQTPSVDQTAGHKKVLIIVTMVVIIFRNTQGSIKKDQTKTMKQI